jgi:hypothetical protein
MDSTSTGNTREAGLTSDMSMISCGEYVDAVMPSPAAVKSVISDEMCVDHSVHVEVQSDSATHTMKRQLDDKSTDTSVSKKIKGGNSQLDVCVNDNTSKQSAGQRSVETTESGDILAAIRILSSDFKLAVATLSERINTLEEMFEQKILLKVNEVVSEKVMQVKKDLTTELNSVRSEVKEVQKAYAEVVKGGTSKSPDISLNFVIKNLPESKNENIVSKVNDLVKDGCLVRDVKILRAERKQTGRDSDAGLVIATCQCKEDKQAIMKQKMKLKSSRNYHNIYIEHDRTREERVQLSNMRTIASVIGPGRVSVRGNRLVVNNGSGYGRDRREQTYHTRGSNGASGNPESGRRNRDNADHGSVNNTGYQRRDNGRDHRTDNNNRQQPWRK